MTQKEEELLLKDLCARLPYGVKCKDQYGDYIDVNIYNAHIEHLVDQISSGVIKMILRPMSSMTEKERKHWRDISLACPDWDFTARCLDWLNSRHFDYRGLLERGLALEAPKGMYDIK